MDPHMYTDRNMRLQRVKRIYNQLGGYVYSDNFSVIGWKYAEMDCRGPEVPYYDDSGWMDFKPGDTFGGVNKYIWFRASVTMPEKFAGKHIRLCLSTGGGFMGGPGDFAGPGGGGWANSNPNFIVFVNGKPVTAFDSHHWDYTLETEAVAGKTYHLAYRGFTGMSDGLAGFNCTLKVLEPDVEKLFYDIRAPFEVTEVVEIYDQFIPQIAAILTDTVNFLDLREPFSPSFFEGVHAASAYLEEKFYKEYCGKRADNVAQISCIGHTHLDIAWLWPMRQTREKGARTFANMLTFMKEYPEFKFMSSQAQIYNTILEDYPEIFEEIKKAVKRGQWEIEGGMWVEADCNLVSGESFVRQFLMGKRFFKKHFGVDCKILWLPDVFGYSAALPQILQKFGMKYFMTTKINWSEYDMFPYDTFTWQGMDGSEVFSHFICCRDMELLRKGAWVTTYNGTITATRLLGTWTRFQQKDICDDVLLSVGRGDGGGGTTREMLEQGRRFSKPIPGIPQVVWRKAGDYFEEWSNKLEGNRFLPKWIGELYLELHRGTLTSMARNKKNNRRTEFLYHNAEFLSVMDRQLLGAEYPYDELFENWKKILTLQFHDILPGSSINQVYEDSDRDYKEIMAAGKHICDEKRSDILSAISVDAPSVIVFNETGMNRDDIVMADISELNGKTLADDDGNIIETQSINGKTAFFVTGIPSKGYKAFKLYSKAPTQGDCISFDGKIAKTPFYTIKFNDKARISSIVCNDSGREVLVQGCEGNRLVAYQDKPLENDAWDIPVFYTEKSWEIDDVSSFELIENGPVLAKIRTVRKFLSSSVTQDMILYKNSPRIDFATTIDWKEHHYLVKAHFPIDVHANCATYEIQFGNVTRPNSRNTSWEFAKFEVCGHKWADLSEDDFGAAILNDCKYGYSCKEHDLALSLLKSATDPNPMADKEIHTFTYSLLPHEGGWKTGGVIPQAYNLNCPMEARYSNTQTGGLPSALSFVSCAQANIMVEAVKRTEDGDDTIVRIYDIWNRKTQAELVFTPGIEKAEICDMMEENTYQTLIPDGNRLTVPVGPFEVVTLKLRFNKSGSRM